MTTYELYLILLNYLSNQPDGESVKAILLELYKRTEKSPTGINTSGTSMKTFNDSSFCI